MMPVTTSIDTYISEVHPKPPNGLISRPVTTTISINTRHSEAAPTHLKQHLTLSVVVHDIDQLHLLTKKVVDEQFNSRASIVGCRSSSVFQLSSA
jgi:hypothetical protein